jgi:hypothetical protein
MSANPILVGHGIDDKEAAANRVALDIAAIKTLEDKFGMSTKDAFEKIYSESSQETLEAAKKHLKYNFANRAILPIDQINEALEKYTKNIFQNPDVFWINYKKVGDLIDKQEGDKQSEIHSWINDIIATGYEHGWSDPLDQKTRFWKNIRRTWLKPALIGAAIGGPIAGVRALLSSPLTANISRRPVIPWEQVPMFVALGTLGGLAGGLMTSGFLDIKEKKKYREGISKFLAAGLPSALSAALGLLMYYYRNKR